MSTLTEAIREEAGDLYEEFRLSEDSLDDRILLTMVKSLERLAGRLESAVVKEIQPENRGDPG